MQRKEPLVRHGASLLEDWHVHSRWSDGKGTLDENIATAKARGLSLLGCVDHVRSDTVYLDDFVADVRRARETTDIILGCGVEAKMLDTKGAVDLPALPAGVDVLLLADHQMPTVAGPVSPRSIRASIEGGDMMVHEAVDSLLVSTARAVERCSQMGLLVVLAHWGSILPKCGIPESALDLGAMEALASLCSSTGTCVEVSERWHCPPLAFLRACQRAGVCILASTDSHVPEKIGVYDHVQSTFQNLGI